MAGGDALPETACKTSGWTSIPMGSICFHCQAFPTTSGTSSRSPCDPSRDVVAPGGHTGDRTVYECRGNYNITHQVLFDLCDADISDPGLSSQFGILKDDCTQKPAFETYRLLIDEPGAP